MEEDLIFVAPADFLRHPLRWWSRGDSSSALRPPNARPWPPLWHLVSFLLHQGASHAPLRTCRDCLVCCPAPARAEEQRYIMLDKSRTCARPMGGVFGVADASSCVGSYDPSKDGQDFNRTRIAIGVAALLSRQPPAGQSARHGRRALLRQACGRLASRWRRRRRLARLSRAAVVWRQKRARGYPGGGTRRRRRAAWPATRRRTAPGSRAPRQPRCACICLARAVCMWCVFLCSAFRYPVRQWQCSDVPRRLRGLWLCAAFALGFEM